MISIDGENKLAILTNGTTTLSISELWSRWIDWLSIGDNSKYPIAMSQIGGDAIGGGKFLGLTFFLENGWKIRPYEGDHALTITGNIFSRDSSPVTTSTIGNYNVLVNLSTSNLVDAISTSGATPTSIADEVWNRMTVSNNDSGSFGELLSIINSTTIANAVLLSQLTTKLDEASLLIETLIKYEGNRTKIDQTAKTMTVYDNDGVTPLRVFDLKNFAGTNSITEVAERVPR